MTATPAVSLQNVTFTFGSHTVLSDVSFDIADGEFVSLIGPNGGGKTTLLKLMLGLLTPRRGTVRIFGASAVEARQRIGYMPQHTQFDSRFPVTVRDVVTMGRLGKRAPWGPFRALDRQAATAALAAAEALAIGERPFADLSGGQRQRVLIARALASEPDLLLLDEPTASLDPAVQDELYELLHRLNERMTVVLVSHDVSVVSQHVHKVVCVNVQVVQNPATEIKGELKKLFAGHDHMRLVRHDHHYPEESTDQR